MSHPVINKSDCVGCGICVDACPQGVIEITGGAADAVNEESCIACGDCIEECPMGAITDIIEE
jgi:NAD-dependent dihydropyrimidine dehydrogenase PreA subunit